MVTADAETSVAVDVVMAAVEEEGDLKEVTVEAASVAIVEAAFVVTVVEDSAAIAVEDFVVGVVALQKDLACLAVAMYHSRMPRLPSSRMLW